MFFVSSADCGSLTSFIRLNETFSAGGFAVQYLLPDKMSGTEWSEEEEEDTQGEKVQSGLLVDQQAQVQIFRNVMRHGLA